MEKKLIETFKDFEFTDLVGFAKLLEVDGEIIKETIVSSMAGSENNSQALESLIISTIENFSLKPRKDRRELLKLAKEIRKENLEAKKKV